MRRQLDTLSFRAALQADRIQVPAGFLGARDRIATFSRLRNRPLVVAGKYDLAAIMTFAREAADAHQQRFGCGRGEAMSIALRAAWAAAKAARLRTAQ